MAATRTENGVQKSFFWRIRSLELPRTRSDGLYLRNVDQGRSVALIATENEFLKKRAALRKKSLRLGLRS